MNDPLAEFPVVQRIAIAYADMDTRRHVNNVTYYKYMESARIAYYERIGRYRFEQESGIVLVVAENGCRYKRSLAYPGEVLVGVRVAEIGADRATMRYRLVDAAGRWIAAEGFAVSVALDTRTGRKTAYPEVLKQRIRALQGDRMTSDDQPVGHGFYFEDVPLGRRFHTFRRTITEADLVGFVGVTGFTEILFTDTEYLKSGSRIQGRVVPGALVYSFSEALLVPSMQGTGMAFLNATIDLKAPTFVGDTIHVECEVIEARLTSKGNAGLVRTTNRVMNQRNQCVMTYNPLRMMKTRTVNT